MTETGAPRAPGKLPRPLKWLAILLGVVLLLVAVLAIGLRLATDRFLRPVVEEQASIAIPGEVSMGGLAVSLLGMSVTVNDLAIRPDAPDAKPVIEVGRLFVSLARLPLLSGRVVVDDLQIESPVLRVVREPSGEIDLLKVVVPDSPVEAPAVETPPSDPVPVLLRRLDLGAGRVEFTDRAQAGAEPLVIELPRSVVRNVVVTGAPGEDRAALELQLDTEGASVAVNGDFNRDGDLLDIDAVVEIAKLPIARARVYGPDLGWTELGGELDAKIHYVHITKKTQTAEGSVALRGLKVGVPGLKEPALSVESLAVKLDQLDLLGRRIAIGPVKLVKPRLFFDPAHPDKQPLLPKGLPAPGEPTPPSDEPPFGWSLASLEIEGAQFVPVGEGLVPLGLDATVGALASAPKGPTDVTLKLAQGDGSVALEGSFYLAPVGFRGKIGLDALALAPLQQMVSTGDGPQLENGFAKGAIDVKLGSLAAGETPTPGGDLLVGGTLTLEKLAARTDAEGSISARIDKLELALQSLDLPGLLPPPAAPDAPAAPPAPDAPVAPGAPVEPEPTSPAPVSQGAPSGADAAAAAAPPAAPAPPVSPAAEPALRWEPPANAGTLRLAGTLQVDGVSARTAKGEPLAFDLKSLTLALKQLELPGALPAADPAKASEGAGRLRVAGSLVLAGIATKSGKEGEFGFDLDRLELGVKQIEVPGLLTVPGAKPAIEPLRVTLDRARIAGPRLRVTRTDTGIVLPSISSAPAPADAKPPERKETKAIAASKAAKPASPGPGIRFELASLTLDGGALRFVDRTVKPYYQGDVSGLSVSARDIGFPEPRARDISVKLDAPGPAPVWVLGSYTPASSWFELNLDKLPLAPLNPYVRNASGYIVNGGELSLYSKGSTTSGQLYVTNWITLFDPDLSGGGPDAPLEKAVGVPVSMVISLLKDPSGNISLAVPIDYNESGASVRLSSVIGSALKQVLIGALTSPLKLLGAVVDTSGRVKDATPQPIGFVPGRAELAPGADDRVGALARLAATRPGLALRLSGQTSGADGQFLREAKLLEAIESGDGLPEDARGLGQALVRRRLRAALEARLDAKPAELDPEDAQKLETWLESMPVGPEALAELARKRAGRVQELLQTQFGLDAKQIRQGEPGPPGGSQEPSVDVAVGS